MCSARVGMPAHPTEVGALAALKDHQDLLRYRGVAAYHLRYVELRQEPELAVGGRGRVVVPPRFLDGHPQADLHQRVLSEEAARGQRRQLDLAAVDLRLQLDRARDDDEHLPADLPVVVDRVAPHGLVRLEPQAHHRERVVWQSAEHRHVFDLIAVHEVQQVFAQCRRQRPQDLHLIEPGPRLVQRLHVALDLFAEPLRDPLGLEELL